MRIDIEKVLGCQADAPEGVVRSAYRRAAKKAHPDGGGSPAAFGKLQLALATMLDPTRKEHWQKTGEASEPEADRTGAKALQSAFQAIDGAIGAMLARGQDPAASDIMGEARRTLAQQIANIDSQVADAKRAMQIAQKMGRRFKPKRGKPDRLGPLWAAKAAACGQAMAKAGEDRPAIEMALQILDEHTFERDPDPRQHMFTLQKLQGMAGFQTSAA